jgi:hypothetical protein
MGRCYFVFICFVSCPCLFDSLLHGGNAVILFVLALTCGDFICFVFADLGQGKRWDDVSFVFACVGKGRCHLLLLEQGG